MAHRIIRLRLMVLAAALACLPLTTVSVNAGKPVPDQSVQATILGNPSNNTSGGIFDDGKPLPYAAVLNANGEFYLNLQPGSSGGRNVSLVFSDRLEPGLCGSSCKSGLVQPVTLLGDGGTGGYLRTNLVDDLDNEVAGGLRDMPVSTTMKARFLVTFEACCDPQSVSRKNPAGTVGFILRYWPAYLHAAYVTVTHPDANHWVITSIDSDGVESGGLYDDAARLIRSNGMNPIYEDLWRMPFQINVSR